MKLKQPFIFFLMLFLAYSLFSLSLLKENARESYAEIGRKIGLSTSIGS